MAKRSLQFSISFAAGTVTGDKVRLYNRTKNESYPEQVTLNASRQAIIDMANFTTRPSVGDVIEIRLNGTKSVMTTHTVVSTSNEKLAIAINTPTVGGINI